MTTIDSYRDLHVWQLAMDLCVRTYQVSAHFPNSEVYGLTAQIRRASVSIPSNIAEGYRRSRADYARFVAIARGSTAELDTQLELAHRIGFLSKDEFTALHGSLDIIGRQLTSLHNKLRATGAKAPDVSQQ
ncbi:MAG: four helix bundle protein [Anaerolineae bacterium]